MKEELAERAIRAVLDNARHDTQTLWELLIKEFPEATPEEIEEAMEAAF